MKYGLEDKPGPGAFLLYGLQWWAVSLPCVIIMGVLVARLHYANLGDQIFYLQKIFGITGLVMAAQLLLGHRLPLVIGPATILLAGLIAALASGLEVLYTSILCGSLFLTLAAVTGLINTLRAFFTPRIVSVVLILIAFTISPSILQLLVGGGGKAAFHLIFGFGLTLAMIMLNQILKGVWKAMTVLIGLAGGSLAYFALTSFPGLPPITPASGSSLFLSHLQFDPGNILAFIFCMLALTINELGSIESIGHLLRADDMPGRVRRGVTVLGLGNLLAAGLAVLGPVSFSMSAGIIAATGCAARRVLLPAAAGLIICAFFPKAVLICSLLPGPVMGAMMFYLMTTQLASGLSMLVAEKGVSDFSSGIVVGFPLMTGLLISFTPAPVFQSLPALIRPIVSNGFVMGVISVILLEHVVFRSARR